MKVKYEKSFLKDLKKNKDKDLSDKVYEFIQNVKSVDSLYKLDGIKKLKGHNSAYRYKIGDFRIGFFLENNTVIFSRFLNRNTIYRQFPY
jgi:mRNA interferase RelE/StbE